MRSRRIAAWTAGVALAVAAIGGTAAGSVAPASAPDGSTTGGSTGTAYVTCSTPPETDGDVTISAARAVRGVTVPDVTPDETCTATE